MSSCSCSRQMSHRKRIAMNGCHVCGRRCRVSIYLNRPRPRTNLSVRSRGHRYNLKRPAVCLLLERDGHAIARKSVHDLVHRNVVRS